MFFDEDILKYYVRAWGEPIKKDTLRLGPPVLDSIYLYHFSPEAGLFVFATLGASRRSTKITVDLSTNRLETRFELFVYAQQPDSELTALLEQLAAYPFLNNTCFGWGHRVPGTEPIAPGCKMTDVLILPPLNEPKDLFIVHIDQDTHVQIFWVVPIYRSEFLFLRENDWRDLVNLFVDNDVDASDLMRKPVI